MPFLSLLVNWDNIEDGNAGQQESVVNVYSVTERNAIFRILNVFN